MTRQRELTHPEPDLATGRIESVLPTKLFVPHAPAGVLPRERLFAQLSAAEPTLAPVTLVSAPAGAGKTTLICTWLERIEARASWLTLDAGDNDPIAFLRGLIAACRLLHVGVGERAEALLAATPPPAPTTVAAALLTDLVSHEVGGALVLDDYHYVDDRTVHEATALLIDRMPPGMTLVLITRSDPPLPLSRLRARGRLTEIRGSDLKFDLPETSAFMERFSVQELTADSVASLATRTEGWAAGLQLAALALRKTGDPGAFITSFAGTHAFVADYLTDEVLRTMPSEEQDFLVMSSLLHRLNGSLCDMALARSGSDELLRRLQRENLFLVALDDERRWCRYHRLFGDLLRRRSRGLPDEERRGILRRASAWCRAHGQPDDAVRYAVAGGDMNTAADIVVASALNALAAGEALTTARWIRTLPEDVVQSSPDHAVIGAWSHSLLEDHEAVRSYTAAARKRLDAGERPYRHIDDVATHLRVISAGALTLDGASTADAHEELVAALEEAAPGDLLLRASAEVMAGNVLGILGRHADALRAFARCHEVADRAGSELLRLAATTGTTEHLLLTGRARQAIALCDAVLDHRRSMHEIIGSQVANLYAIRARAHLEVGTEEAAARDLKAVWNALGAEGEGSVRWSDVARFGQAFPTAFHSSAPGLFHALTTSVRSMLLRGRFEEAEAELEKVAIRLSTAPNALARVALESLRVKLWAARGEKVRLLRWSGEPPPPRCGCAYWDQVDGLARARAALEGGDTGTAIHLLDALLPELERLGAGLNLAEARLLRARAGEASGAASAADEATRAALELTTPDRLSGPWLADGMTLFPLLQRVVAGATASPDAVEHAVTLLQRLNGKPRSPRGPAACDLSERELEILRLVAAGYSNREIADTLVLAVGTVKKHTHNLYRKLGVRSRTQAIRVARERELLAAAE